MEELIKKIENYKILNYILPGIIFGIFSKYYIGLDIIKNDNLIVSAFIYYFIGIIISRVGSLIVKPLLWKFKILKNNNSSNNKDFYKAENEDDKIKILFIDYNMYRNFIALFLSLLLIKPIIYLKRLLCINNTICFTILIILLIILFIQSYKQQMKYINQRIENCKNK